MHDKIWSLMWQIKPKFGMENREYNQLFTLIRNLIMNWTYPDARNKFVLKIIGKSFWVPKDFWLKRKRMKPFFWILHSKLHFSFYVWSSMQFRRGQCVTPKCVLKSTMGWNIESQWIWRDWSGQKMKEKEGRWHTHKF